MRGRWGKGAGGAAALALLLGAATGSVLAQSFYKWVDEKGVTHYTATPPPKGGSTTVTVDPGAVTAFAPAPKVDPLPPAAGGAGKVVMYSAEWCGVCKRARAYMQREKIPFTEYDVERSEKGRSDFARYGGKGVPLILVGEQKMRGFDEKHLQRLLKQ